MTRNGRAVDKSSAVIFSAVAYNNSKNAGGRQTPFSVDFLGFTKVLSAIELSLDREHGMLDTDSTLAEQARQVLERQRQAERLVRANGAALERLLLQKSVSTASAREAAVYKNEVLHEEETEEVEEGDGGTGPESFVIVDLEEENRNEEQEGKAREEKEEEEEEGGRDDRMREEKEVDEVEEATDGEGEVAVEELEAERKEDGGDVGAATAVAQAALEEKEERAPERLPFARLITLSTTEAASNIFDLCAPLYSNT